jgi:CRP-like cAMP-binding protein
MDVSAKGEDGMIERLRAVPLFADLKSEQLAALARRLRPEAFEEDQTIFLHGDPGDCLYVIRQGRVRIELPSTAAPPVILRVLEPGEFFGEMALCDGKSRSASAVAMEPTQVLALFRDDFRDFLESSPEAAIHLLAVLAERLRATSERLMEGVIYDTSSRLARLLLHRVESEGTPSGAGMALDRQISPDELAEGVGATVERIRQELDSLEQDQIITLGDDRIAVLRPTLLRERIHRKPTVGPGAVTIPTWLLE